MPRVPSHQIPDDEWEDPEELEIQQDDDDPQTVGRRPAREDLDWEERRRNLLRRRNRNQD